jgi:uncharacterized protein with von Willebrand factor type A (vWA) domain
MRKTPEPQELAKQFNNLRERVKYNTYSFKEVQELLRDMTDLPSSMNYMTHYINKGVILHVKHGVYKFPENPVYYQKIQEAILARRAAQVKYQEENSPENKYRKELDKRAKIKEAIELLKANGYLVFKPI